MVWGEPVAHCRGLPRWHSGKEAACQCRRHKMSGFDPWVEKIPWNRKWHATPVFSLENSMERKAWWATVHGVTKSQTLLSMCAHTHTHTHTHTLLTAVISNFSCSNSLGILFKKKKKKERNSDVWLFPQTLRFNCAWV